MASELDEIARELRGLLERVEAMRASRRSKVRGARTKPAEFQPTDGARAAARRALRRAGLVPGGVKTK